MAPIHSGANGASAVEMSATGYGGGPARPVATPPNPSRLPKLIIRLLVIALTFIATIVMGVAKQTSREYQATVKSSQSSSFVYFVVANAFVCVYSAMAVGFSFFNSSSSSLELILTIADVLALGFLFTSNAAAMAVDVLARKGNEDFGWGKFCNIADKFCGEVTAAIVLSSLATVAYALLLVLSIVSIHKRSVY
ncbi:hypothetical protein KFK09_011002 [Dendrobium nobile]|uniref:CASP-like protein n=1 Tax=Dendrobium nobile TaxID=94219 RepID=A0A8T3BEE9_DENNO|nr:hypothetical protein KFK09_011002 [Dendrobium nobile]